MGSRHQGLFKMRSILALALLCAVANAANIHSPFPGAFKPYPKDLKAKLQPVSRTPVGVEGSGINGRIVGGTVAERGEFPWQVSWRSLGSHSCGGSILSENWVLSAGHCCAGLGTGDIVAGGIDIYFPEGVEQHRTPDKFSHPDYDSATINNDVCLLKMDEPFEFNDEVMPIELDTSLDWSQGQTFTVSGWGSTFSGGFVVEKLHKVEVPFVSTDDCNASYNGNGYSITDGMICAGEKGKDSCQGDSGGPMVASVNGTSVLVGVVSWGIGCAQEGYPGVYARVANYVDWIEETMANN